jgi:hypothetical protein
MGKYRLSMLSLSTCCNSLSKLLPIKVHQWLAQNESESSDEEEYTFFRSKTNQAVQNEQSMLQQRNSTIERNFREIKYKATPKQKQKIFENLSSIQKNIQKSSNNMKEVMPLSRTVTILNWIKLIK